MNNNLENVGWAIVGTPDGMQTKNGGCIANFDIGNLVDINNLKIKSFPNSEIICVLRENRRNRVITYYMLYNYAKEIRTDRSGTFYGSVLVLVDNILRSDVVIQILREISAHLSKYLTSDKRFTTNISNIELPIPKTLNAVAKYMQPITPSQVVIGNVEGLVLPQNNSNDEMAQWFFNFANKIDLVKSYARLYSTLNKEVINYVREKGILIEVEPKAVELQLWGNQLKLENNQFREQISILKAANEQISATNEKLNQKVAELSAENDILTHNNTEKDTEIINLNKDLKRLNYELDKTKQTNLSRPPLKVSGSKKKASQSKTLRQTTKKSK